MLSLHEIIREHDDLAIRLSDIAELMNGQGTPDDISRLCAASMQAMMRHMENEERIMAGMGYPREKLDRHVEHHRFLAERIGADIRGIAHGRIGGSAAVLAAYDLMRSHFGTHDRELCEAYEDETRMRPPRCGDPAPGASRSHE